MLFSLMIICSKLVSLGIMKYLYWEKKLEIALK